jgi:hypothetical protein
MIWSVSVKDVMEHIKIKQRALADARNSSNSRDLPPVTKRKIPGSVPTSANVIELE